MLKGINFQELFKARTAAGVEVIFSDKGEPEIHLTILQKTKSGLELKTTQTFIHDIGTIQQSISSDIPVNLVLSGKGIIHKLVSYKEPDNDSSLLQKVLPNADINEFYIEIEPSNDNRVMVSIIRKELADEILNSFGKNEMHVVSASLGPFCLLSIHNLLNGNASKPSAGHEGNNFEINVAGYRLVYINNKIQEFFYNANGSDEIVQIAGETLKQQSVIPFAAAFNYVYSGAESIPTRAPSISMGREEFINKRLFNTMGWGILIFFFSLLLINFLLFNSFSNQYRVLEQKVFRNKDKLFYYEKLKNEVEEKQNFLRKSGLSESSRTSFYADRLAANLPENIQLTEMKINPAEIKTGYAMGVSASGKKENTITFRMKTISIAGYCKKGSALNKWTGIIRDYQWSDYFSIENYNKATPDAPGEFLVEISTK